MQDVKHLLNGILWTAKQVAGLDSKHRKVYPIDKIYNAFEPSRCQIEIDLYKKYQSFFTDVHAKIEFLNERLRHIMKELNDTESYRNLNTRTFDVIEYLDFNAVRVHYLLEWGGPTALCFPEEDSSDLIALYNHYHQCHFFIRHRQELGEKLFFNCTDPLRASITIERICANFLWDDDLAQSQVSTNINDLRQENNLN